MQPKCGQCDRVRVDGIILMAGKGGNICSECVGYAFEQLCDLSPAFLTRALAVIAKRVADMTVIKMLSFVRPGATFPDLVPILVNQYREHRHQELCDRIAELDRQIQSPRTSTLDRHDAQNELKRLRKLLEALDAPD